jgi:hypothetical protein
MMVPYTEEERLIKVLDAMEERSIMTPRGIVIAGLTRHGTMAGLAMVGPDSLEFAEELAPDFIVRINLN